MTNVTWDPVHDGRHVFRTALDAMCDPGLPAGAVPNAGLSSDPLLDKAAALLLALLDPGLGFAVTGAAMPLVRLLEQLTGATETTVGQADFVLVADGTDLPVAATARRGVPLAPERGATIIYAGTWVPVGATLSGPGLAAPRRAWLQLPPGELPGLIEANRRPPLGVDVFLAGRDGLAAIPRSLTIEPA